MKTHSLLLIIVLLLNQLLAATAAALPSTPPIGRPAVGDPLPAPAGAARPVLQNNSACVVANIPPPSGDRRLYLPIILKGPGGNSAGLQTNGNSTILPPTDLTSADLPPDPATVAPVLDLTVATDFYSATTFLYTGSNPIQIEVTPGTIRPQYAAVVRGRTLTRAGSPLPGVLISVLDHPEYGCTFSRADGTFDLAVNGGGQLTVDYRKSGYAPAQRQVTPPWRDYTSLPEVVLIQRDSQVTAIDLTSSEPMQVAQGSVVADTDGSRQAALFIPQGTQAAIYNTDGTTQTVSSLHLRLTEYTVGENGPQAMPAPLPPNSGYTYAIELSADEATTKISGRDVLFNQPVIFYVQNFLDFQVGVPVPMGYYDNDRGMWVASDSGRVIKIISLNGGLAELDVDGDGAADSGSALAGMGITDAERARLAALYAPGQSLWRIMIDHLSSWDANQNTRCANNKCEPSRLPDREQDPPQEEPGPQDEPPQDDPDQECRSIVNCQDQTLGEMVEVAGTPFRLFYQSARAPGLRTAYHLTIPLSGRILPENLQRIYAQVSIAGRRFTTSHPAAPNQQTTFTWDGRDAYGRLVNGRQMVIVQVGYSYQLEYVRTDRFGYNGNGVAISTNPARGEFTLWQTWRFPVGNLYTVPSVLGGWSLDVHHIYDPTGKTLYLGDGRRRSAESLNFSVITAVAGGSGPCQNQPACGDGSPATVARLVSPQHIALGPDGSLFISDGTNRIRRVGPNGIITAFAGSGVSGYSGDGGPATAAQFRNPRGLAVGPDGSLYIADSQNYVVRRVGPDGIITTVAGTGVHGFSGDGGPATQARLGNIQDVALGPDGTLYIADYSNNRVRRVGSDGLITTVVGGGSSLYNDGIPATQVHIAEPISVVVGLDGALYLANQPSGFPSLRGIWRVGPDGLITTVIGQAGVCSSPIAACGDGGPASEAQIAQLRGIGVGPDGSLYLVDLQMQRVRRIGPDGIISTVAGTGQTCPNSATLCGDGGPARRARLSSPMDVVVAPNGDFLIADMNNHRIRRVALALPGSTFDENFLTAEDGSEVYVFDATGRHLRTLNPLTGAILYQFTYNNSGLLAAVTDANGNITTVERDANGKPAAIVGPYGQRTTLALNGDGYLQRITNPAGESFHLTYTNDGLLTGFTNPRGQTSTFTYDEAGRLIRDNDPAGGFMALARSGSRQRYAVNLSTALGRTTTYQVTGSSLDGQERLNTWPGGLQSTYDKGTDGSRSRTFPDGSATSLLLGPDPRWGMLVPLATTAVISTPGGLQVSLAATRTATLNNANNPFSLVSLTQNVVLNGRTYTSLYHAASRTFTETTPAGRLSTAIIDSLGRPLQTQAAGLAPATFTYDSRGRLASASQGTGGETRTVFFTYNSQGYLAGLTDPLSRTVSFSYDAAGRVIQQTLPDGRLIGYGYDANGNLTSLTPPGRPAHTFTYTPVDLPASYTPPDVVAGPDGTGYSYNLDRQLTQLTRPDGQTASLGYDSAGRVSSLTLARGAFNYSYHPTSGNFTGISAPGGLDLAYSYDGSLLTGQSWTGPISGSVSYSYDNNFRLASSSVNGANTIAFQYDPDSLLTGAGALSLSRSPQNGLLTGSTLGSLTDAWNYNSFAEPTGYNAAYNSSPLFQTQYGRDRLGRITVMTETISGVTTAFGYSYDLAGRLTGVTQNGGSNAAYSYDSNGNRLSFTGPGGTVAGTYDAQDRLLQYGSAVYSYTANGELQSKTAAGQTTVYQYDELGNLMAVTLPNGDQISYLVDGQNRRIGKRVNGTLVQGFLYEGNLRPAAEFDGAGSLVSRFVYATRINVPDYMVKNGVTYRLLLDHLGSPRLVVNTATGQVAQRMDYDAFGRVLTDTNPGFQPFGFAGGLYDTDTGLVRFGARDYDAEIGRWTAKDPIGFSNQTSNLYNYGDDDPINLVDPWGLESTECPPKTWDQRARKLLDKLKKIPDAITKRIPPIDRLKEGYGKLEKLEKWRDEALDTYEAWKSPDPRDWARALGRAFEHVPQSVELIPTEAVKKTIEVGIESASDARESLEWTPNSNNPNIRERWYQMNADRY